MKQLYRSDKNKILTGIFGGLGEYFKIDPTILRVFWIFVVIFTGFFPGLIAYIFAYFIIPRHNNKKIY
ncbi:PspC domain-containing protein [Candidatus Wolfebacteria bacterium]|nr:PspC domain-containing protein [Candidatus Wolfebacteria bacterium]